MGGGGGVPEPRRVVMAAGEYGLAVGAERHGPNRALVLHGGPMGLPVAASQSRAVLSSLPVSTALPSGLNATARPCPGAPGWARWVAGGGVPEPRRVVIAAGEYGLAVGAERHGPTPPCCVKRWPDGLAGGGVPEPRLVSATASEYGLAVGAERHGRRPRPGAPVVARWACRWRRPRAAPSCHQLPVSTALPSGLNATATTCYLVPQW